MSFLFDCQHLCNGSGPVDGARRFSIAVLALRGFKGGLLLVMSPPPCCFYFDRNKRF